MTDLNLQSVIDSQPQRPGTANCWHPHQIIQFERYVDGRDKVSQKWSFKNEPPG